MNTILAKVDQIVRNINQLDKLADVVISRLLTKDKAFSPIVVGQTMPKPVIKTVLMGGLASLHQAGYAPNAPQSIILMGIERSLGALPGITALGMHQVPDAHHLPANT